MAHRPLVDRSVRGRSGGRRERATRARARHARAGAWRCVVGPESVVRRVGEHTWDLPVGAFWQPHRSAAAHYADVVGAAVATAPGLGDQPAVWDLYGGAGLFTAAALDVCPGARLTLVESASVSVEAAVTGLGHSPGLHAVDARVEEFLAGDGARGHGPGGDPDLVVLDPPRGGAGTAVMSELASRVRSRIVHVGCDPASLARDIGVLVAAGWRLVELRGVAAFPGTSHVEGLAVLDSPRA